MSGVLYKLYLKQRIRRRSARSEASELKIDPHIRLYVSVASDLDVGEVKRRVSAIASCLCMRALRDTGHDGDTAPQFKVTLFARNGRELDNDEAILDEIGILPPEGPPPYPQPMLRFAVTRIDGTFAQQSVDNAFNTDSDTEDSAPAPVGTGVPSATSHIKSLSMACFHLLEPLAKGATNAQTRGVAKTLHQTHAAGREFAARVEAKLASGALKGSHEEILAWQAGCNNLRINYAEGLRLYNHRFPDNVQTVERTIPYQKPPEKEESPIHVASSLPESTGIALPWGVGASRRRQNSGGGTASGGGGGSDTRPRANSASKTQRSLESTASSSSNMSTLYSLLNGTSSMLREYSKAVSVAILERDEVIGCLGQSSKLAKEEGTVTPTRRPAAGRPNSPPLQNEVPPKCKFDINIVAGCGVQFHVGGLREQLGTCDFLVSDVDGLHIDQDPNQCLYTIRLPLIHKVRILRSTAVAGGIARSPSFSRGAGSTKDGVAATSSKKKKKSPSLWRMSPKERQAHKEREEAERKERERIETELKAQEAELSEAVGLLHKLLDCAKGMGMDWRSINQFFFLVDGMMREHSPRYNSLLDARAPNRDFYFIHQVAYSGNFGFLNWLKHAALVSGSVPLTNWANSCSWGLPHQVASLMCKDHSFCQELFALCRGLVQHALDYPVDLQQHLVVEFTTRFQAVEFLKMLSGIFQTRRRQEEIARRNFLSARPEIRRPNAPSRQNSEVDPASSIENGTIADLRQHGRVLQRELELVKKKRIFNELARVWHGRHSTVPIYTPVGKKGKGCAVGAIYEKQHTKPKSLQRFDGTHNQQCKKWLGKIGGAGTLHLREGDSVDISGDMSTILEKIGGDTYGLLGYANGIYSYNVPKQRLAYLPIQNDFNKSNFLVGEMLRLRREMTGAGDSVQDNEVKALYLMSKFVDRYCDLASLQVVEAKDKKAVYSYSDFVDKFQRPPEWAMVKGQIIPILGTMECLAVSAVLADTDVFGGSYNNAGYTVTFSRNLKATTVRLVKIDAGEVFGFSKPYNRFTNTLAAKSGKQQNGGGFFGFEDPRDIQLGNACGVVKWSKLKPGQRAQFTERLEHAFKVLLQTEGMMRFLLYREGQFSRVGEHANGSPLSGESGLSTELVEGLLSEWEQHFRNLLQVHGL